MANSIITSIKKVSGIIIMVIGFPFYILDRACYLFIQNGTYAIFSFICGGFVILHFFTGVYESGISLEDYWKALTNIWNILSHGFGTIFVVGVLGMGLEMICSILGILCKPGVWLYHKGKSLHKSKVACVKPLSKIESLSNRPNPYRKNQPQKKDIHRHYVKANSSVSDNPSYSRTTNSSDRPVVTLKDIEDSDIIL